LGESLNNESCSKSSRPSPKIFSGFFQSSQIFLEPRIEVSVYENSGNSFSWAPSISHLIPLSFRAGSACHQLPNHLALLLLATHASLLPHCCALPHAAMLHRLSCCCRTCVRAKYSSADAWFKASPLFHASTATPSIHQVHTVLRFTARPFLIFSLLRTSPELELHHTSSLRWSSPLCCYPCPPSSAAASADIAAIDR
jgi:hypothetical protein